MSKLSIRGYMVSLLGALALMSCGDGINKTETTYVFKLSKDQLTPFKSDLEAFAIGNDYSFLDGSTHTKKAREAINRESERTLGNNAGLVAEGIQLIDVTIEPRDAESHFLIFAKTSAYDAEEVSLTMIHNESSLAEKAMADRFLQSRFLANWTKYIR